MAKLGCSLFASSAFIRWISEYYRALNTMMIYGSLHYTGPFSKSELMLELQRVPVAVCSDFKFSVVMERLSTSATSCIISRFCFPLHIPVHTAIAIPEREAESLEVSSLSLNCRSTG